MKSLVVALGVFSLTAISCTQSDKSPQPNKSEIESKRSPGGSGSGQTSGTPQVTGFSANVAGPTEISLKWNSVPGATSYWIYRDKYVPAIVTTTNYADRSVRPATTYIYAIAAVVSNKLGPKSSPVTVTTPR